MAKVDINSDQWCDLVFENRNTEFGAFVLRKESNKRHLKALIIAVLIFLIAITTPILVKKIIENAKANHTTAVQISDIHVENIKKPEPPKPDIPVEPKVVERNTVQFIPPVITADKNVRDTDEIKPTVQVMVDTHTIGTKTVTTGSDTAQIRTQTAITGTTPTVDPIIEVPQTEAQFPGGITALYDFLNKNITYPAADRDAGVQGRVVVSFVIAKDGRISEVKIMKSLSPGCDEEAVRLVQSMPPWSPGKQGDVAVRSRRILPIVFKIQDQN